MTERKVLNKYYPPDFDPSKLPRLRLPKNRQFNVRIMAPCNMKCNTCGEYIYKGKKFNSRQETVDGEAYLGLRIYRFYIKCPRCMSEITFKTNLEEMDYELEHGATRNFQAVRLAEQQAEKQEEARVEEEKSNPMIALERRTQDSRHEMDRLEALEELKDLNTRQANVNYDDVIRMTVEKEMQALREQEEADEAFVRSIFSKDEGTIMKRLRDSDSSEEEDLQRSYVPITNATDILASSSLANDLKKPKIVTELVPWQKSVGSLSRGNGSLASFVRPKQWKITMPFTSPADPCDLGGSTSAVAVGKSSGLSSLANQYGTDSDDND